MYVFSTPFSFSWLCMSSFYTSHPSKSSHHTTVPFVSGCAVENDEESGPVSGLSIVLGVIRGSRDKYALQAAAADVLRAAVEAGATS